MLFLFFPRPKARRSLLPGNLSALLADARLLHWFTQTHGQHSPLLLVASLFLGQEPLVASFLLVAMPFAPSSVLVPRPGAPSSVLVPRPGAPSSVLAPSSDALCY